MKISYEIVTGEITETEVDEHLGGLLLDFDRRQYNNDQKETRRHVSLDGMVYEGGLFASVENTESEAERREDMTDLFSKYQKMTLYIDMICNGVYNLLIDYNKWLHGSLYCQMQSWDI